MQGEIPESCIFGELVGEVEASAADSKRTGIHAREPFRPNSIPLSIGHAACIYQANNKASLRELLDSTRLARQYRSTCSPGVEPSSSAPASG